MTKINSDDLQLVVTASLARTQVAGRTVIARGIPEVLADVVKAFNDAGLEYALGGALAYGLYAKARNTKDIDFLLMQTSKQDVKQALKKLGLQQLQDLDYMLQYKDRQSGVEVDILLGEIDPEQSAVEDSKRAVVFGVPTLVIKPEYLLWMYCNSDLRKHEVDGIELIKSGKVDIAKLRRFLDYAGDDAAKEQLNKLVTLAGKERHASYSDATAERVARLKGRQSED